MRITRESLIRLARESVAFRLMKDRQILCVYLTGSILSRDPLIGGTTDIDLIMVHPDDPPFPREIVKVSDEVHLDIFHHPQSLYQFPRHLRADPWLGSFLCANPMTLHDVHHWFEFTQASVFAQFNQPDNILERSRSLYNNARQTWWDLRNEEYSSPIKKVQGYLQSIENAANAIACLNGVPLTERRLFLNFPQRAQACGAPELSAQLSALIANQNLSDENWQQWLPKWREDLKHVSSLTAIPYQLSPYRLNYYSRAASSLWSDHPTAAFWIMLNTWTSAVEVTNEDQFSDTWMETCRLMGFLDENFLERIGQLDSLLDSIDETLDLWADANGIAR